MNLVEMLMNQVNTPENRQKFAGMIGSEEGAGNVLQNLVPFVTKALGNQDESTMSNLLENAQNAQGSDMVSQLLGSKAGLVTQFLGKSANMDAGQSENLLGQFLPMVMGALGQAKQSEGMDASAFSNLLNKSNTEAAQSNNQFGMIASLLDQDGDGEITDDLLNMGKNMLGGLFK